MTFAHLDLILDTTAHGPGENMARDEALLRHARGPVLRCYSWKAPALSVGVFQSLSKALEGHRDLPAVRRFTGGGAVVHGKDFTYALIAPAGDPACGMTTSIPDSYAAIHSALCSALTACAGIHPILASTGAATHGGHCFKGPVRSDVLWQNRKIAGAAQRRTRAGLLHQGSVQGLPIPEGFAMAFAEALAGRVTKRPYQEAELRLAEHLAKERYNTESWLLRHP